MSIYISGKITGLDLDVARSNFNAAEDELLTVGFSTINPMKECPYVEGKTWNEYMLDCIKLLFKCDAIYMLNNWMDSKGARIELSIAREMNIDIIFQKENR